MLHFNENNYGSSYQFKKGVKMKKKKKSFDFLELKGEKNKKKGKIVCLQSSNILIELCKAIKV